MHQHLVTFLAHRFGLKKLSAEWHQGLQAAMATFESADAHVKLFRKVLPSRARKPRGHGCALGELSATPLRGSLIADRL